MARIRNSVKIGVIGCGHVTKTWHLPALRHIAHAEVDALADVNSDLLIQVADLFQVPHRYNDYRELLSDPSVEAVAVCVPAKFHLEVGLASLEAGKHLFMEKPLALDLNDCDKIIEKAKKSSLIAMVGFNLRWHRLIQEALRLIRSGKLGPIKMVRSVFTCKEERNHEELAWRKRREDGGGTIIEMAVHHFDLWRLLLDSEVEEVYALSNSDISDDETATITARMSNGAIATSSLSEKTSSENELEIYGQKGSLKITLTRFDGLRFLPRQKLPGDVLTHIQGILHYLKELPQVLLRIPRPSDWAGAFHGEWLHFLEAIKGREEVKCTLTDGRRAMEIALTAVESAEKGVPVKVSSAPAKITPVLVKE